MKTFKTFLEDIHHPTIEVDGEHKHVNNSEGKRIHPTDEGIRNFWRWFGNSSAVDDHGRPLVVYHGTSKDIDFKKFKSPQNGIWFTPDKQSASDYALGNDSQKDVYNPDTRRYEPVHTSSRVLPCYIRMNNPKILTDYPEEFGVSDYKKAQRSYFTKLKNLHNHDSIFYTGNCAISHVVFDPNQVKSAIGNNGNFSSKPNINEDLFS